MRTPESRWLAATVLMLAYTIASATPIEDTVGADGFRLLSPTEEAAHRRQMSRLDGDARARYRDAQWRRLRERAAEHGYLMPLQPPWPAAKPATGSARRSPPKETARPGADPASEEAAATPPTTAATPSRQPPAGIAPPATSIGPGTSDRRAAARRRQRERDARHRLQDARQAELRARIDRALDRFSAPLPVEPPSRSRYGHPRPPPR